MQAPGTALLVEDEPQVAAALRRQLARAGFVVYEAHGERDAVAGSGDAQDHIAAGVA